MTYSAISACLSTAERRDFRKLEGRIEAGAAAFQSVGRTLAEIKERKLYRADYPDFAAYCRDRWPFGKAYAYRLIRAAAVVSNLAGELTVGDVDGLTESAVRPLTGLPADLQAPAYEAARTEPDRPPLPERLADIVARVKAATPEERPRIIQEEEAASKRRAEQRQGDAVRNEEARRWKRALDHCRLARKELRGVVGSEEEVELLEQVMRRACDETDTTYDSQGLQVAELETPAPRLPRGHVPRGGRSFRLIR